MKSIASFTEYYLRCLDKLEALGPDARRRFWAQRDWHPVVKMTWNTLTVSDGEGVITYPDGSKRAYAKPL